MYESGLADVNDKSVNKVGTSVDVPAQNLNHQGKRDSRLASSSSKSPFHFHHIFSVFSRHPVLNLPAQNGSFGGCETAKADKVSAGIFAKSGHEEGQYRGDEKVGLQTSLVPPLADIRLEDGLQVRYLRSWAMKTTSLSSFASISSRVRAL